MTSTASAVRHNSMGQKNSQGCTERPNATAKENTLTALDPRLGTATPDLLRLSTQLPV